jgi:Fe-S-cluster-containing dehydrogenase component
MACPFNAVIPNEEEGVVAKCNLCPEEDIPPCVKACQSEALVYREPMLFAQDKRKTFLRDQKVHHEGG